MTEDVITCCVSRAIPCVKGVWRNGGIIINKGNPNKLGYNFALRQ
jgi:hypothetical protein